MAGKTVGATAASLLLLTLLVAAGCQKGAVPPSASALPPEGQVAQEQPATPQEQALQELLRYAQESGQTLEQVRQDLESLRAAQRQEGPSSVQADAKVLELLVAQCKAAVAAKDTTKSQGLLMRMGRVGRGILGETPAQQISMRIERALALLTPENPDTTGARGHIVAALGIATMPGQAGLVPDVGKDLEGAKAALPDTPDDARKWLAAALDACAKNQPYTWAYDITIELTNAYGSVTRGAWIVASAQLDEVEALITKIQTAGTPSSAPAATAAGAGQAPGSGAAGTQPAAPGQAPAAGAGEAGVAPSAPQPQAPSGNGAAAPATGSGSSTDGAAQPPAQPTPPATDGSTGVGS